ncbi:MAG TPA: ABC transporter substrate-binding protein, partial [Chloroflexota bacterium]
MVDYRVLFNGDIAVADDRAVPVPDLVEALPRLNSDSWQVLPDGRMQTTYHLRPNLTWHDGTQLSADDFVFGYQVYSTPEVGLSLQTPFIAIEGVEAPDPRTLVIRWKRPYPDAGHMTGRDQSFPALPRHLLATAFANQSVESFLTHPYWAREFLGSGPYRVLQWEPGAFIDAAAFDGYARGRPKIDRLKITFSFDANTLLANLLSGELDFAGGSTMGARDAATLQQEWQAKRGGVVLYQARNWRGLSIQFLPGLTTPRALLDVRVREALAHGIDRAALSDAIYAGTASEADYFLPPDGAWGPEVQRGAIKYGYDLQHSEQLMREAGFEKSPDGTYASPQEGQFAVEARVTAASASELAALADGLGRAGFKIDQRLIPQALALDLETKAGYPGMFLTTQVATERTATAPIPGNIPTPENGWRGGSQISWTHPEYTRLVQQFTS